MSHPLSDINENDNLKTNKNNYYNDNDDDNLLDKIKTNRNTIALNLFANDKIPIDVKVINDGIYEDFIMCLSHENIEFVDKIYNDFNNSTNIQDLSIRDGNIGRYQRYERIFKI